MPQELRGGRSAVMTRRLRAYSPSRRAKCILSRLPFGRAGVTTLTQGLPGWSSPRCEKITAAKNAIEYHRPIVLWLSCAPDM